jgi:hypothetical protein
MRSQRDILRISFVVRASCPAFELGGFRPFTVFLNSQTRMRKIVEVIVTISTPSQWGQDEVLLAANFLARPISDSFARFSIGRSQT